MAAQSPSSSPRLPSPPPMAEDQIGPTSPGLSLYEDQGKLQGAGSEDVGALRRIRPGTKADDMAEGPPLIELQDIDSAFPLTEHLKALYHSYTHPTGSYTTNPITADIAKQLATPPPNTSKDIWLYELGRFLIQKTNSIVVSLFADSPPCSAQTCPEMRASEWQYLCAVHDPPKSCNAIDYCCHTLDWAATTLTSSKMFPSRLGLGSGSGGAMMGGPDKVLQQQMKEITNIFRRVYRIYAHAWFQHRDVFWRVEGKTGLYVLFKTICDDYGLIQPENYTIPPEAEGLEPADLPFEQKASLENKDPVQILPSPFNRDISSSVGENTATPEPPREALAPPGDLTKRHKHSMSDRISSVSTVIQEEAEEDESSAPKTGLNRQDTVLRHGLPDSTIVETEISEPSPPSEGDIGPALELPHISKQVDPQAEAVTQVPDSDADTTVIESSSLPLEGKQDKEKNIEDATPLVTIEEKSSDVEPSD